MRYPPEQVEQLAAEYVLGTLTGRARRRFLSLMQRRADVQRAVWEWERCLNGLAAGVKPEKPPRRLWKEIRRRIRPASKAKAPARWLKTAAGIPVVAAAAAWLAMSLRPAADVDRVAVFADTAAQPLWSISADIDRRRLIAETFTPPASGAGSVYELWLLPAGADPVSLGILSEAAGVIASDLTLAELDAFALSASLAVSVEPAGGSPTGLPTGPVVYQAALVRL